MVSRVGCKISLPYHGVLGNGKGQSQGSREVFCFMVAMGNPLSKQRSSFPAVTLFAT